MVYPATGHQLPSDRVLRSIRLSQGWSLSSTTHSASGFPLRFVNGGDELVDCHQSELNQQPQYPRVATDAPGGPWRLSSHGKAQDDYGR